MIFKSTVSVTASTLLITVVVAATPGTPTIGVPALSTSYSVTRIVTVKLVPLLATGNSLSASNCTFVMVSVAAPGAAIKLVASDSRMVIVPPVEVNKVASPFVASSKRTPLGIPVREISDKRSGLSPATRAPFWSIASETVGALRPSAIAVSSGVVIVAASRVTPGASETGVTLIVSVAVPLSLELAAV